MSKDPCRDVVAAMVRLNGGRIAGSTRLQKTVFLAQKAGFIDCFNFNYHHYGPYSPDLSAAVDRAQGTGVISSRPVPGSFGLTYWEYTDMGKPARKTKLDPAILPFLRTIEDVDAITLEVAATWLFLMDDEGFDSDEAVIALRRLKPGKASPDRLRHAEQLLRKLHLFPTSDQ